MREREKEREKKRERKKELARDGDNIGSVSDSRMDCRTYI